MSNVLEEKWEVSSIDKQRLDMESERIVEISMEV